MKIFYFIILPLCLLLPGLSCISRSGGEKAPSVRSPGTDGPIFIGSKTLYTPQQTIYTPPPSGYEPVFINYVGRHGARFLTSAGDDVALQSLLDIAEKQEGLTAMGRRLKRMLILFSCIERNNYGNITLAGRDEQAGIAARMLNLYPGLFKGKGMDVIVSQKIRTKQSAEAFLTAFKTYPPEKIHLHTPVDSLNDALCFYDISPEYKHFEKGPVVRERMDSLANDPRTRETDLKVASRIFTDQMLVQLKKGNIDLQVDSKAAGYDMEKFVKNLYALYLISFAMHKEMAEKDISPDSLNFGIFFSKEDLAWLNFRDGAEDFLVKGPGLDPAGIQVRNAVPLLIDFINTIDSSIAYPGQPDARLRFGHAEAISPFATLLGIPVASHACSSIFRYADHWNAASVMCMSSNIQWILYANRQQDHLIKVLLNEKEVHLPIATDHYPYYPWNDVKKYYIGLLSKLHVNLDDDMHAYLQHLQE